MTIQTLNPATNTPIKTYNTHTKSEVNHIIERAHATFSTWRKTPFSERKKYLLNAKAILLDRLDEYTALMADEMGKPIKNGRAEIEKCAWACEFYAEHAEDMLQPEMISTDAQKSYMAHSPLGVVLAIMPWNYPFWQVIRFAAPALMAGNIGLLKHASNVSGCALALEELFKNAGFPEHAFSTLFLKNSEVEHVIQHPHVKAITLTGSTRAGKAVASEAGQVLKKVVLELGGSDPYIILEDADLNKAVPVCAASRLTNSGQSCIAAKRFIVVRSKLKAFEDALINAMQQFKMGDPHNADTDIGPQAQYHLRDELHTQVQKSIAQGARCLLGGEIPNDKGAYYPATILTDVKPGMPAYEEELFGPVASIISVEDEAEAIRVANDTCFGLGSAIFTEDIERGERLAVNEIEAGCCFVNAQVKSDPRLPFGGIKESGYGRELSDVGMKEFVNLKTIYIVSS